MAEKPRMNVKRITIGLCLLKIFMILLRVFMPTNVPIRQNEPIQRPYCISNISLTTNVTVDAPVENIIMYMPVAEATFGGTPILKSRGLNIAPPPNPRAPETHPPKKE
jgi:hypothetical protein